MRQSVTLNSRTALARARLFLAKAKTCEDHERVDFEAFLEAAIVFARAAVHRFQSQHSRHREWKGWWDSLRGNAAVEFFRVERDFILKEASPKIGQKIFAASIGVGGTHIPVRPRRQAAADPEGARVDRQGWQQKQKSQLESAE